MYKVFYEDEKLVPCAIKVEAKYGLDAMAKACKFRKGSNWRFAEVYSDEEYRKLKADGSFSPQ